MIGTISNNRPSGSTTKECDAGTPISGRTASNGVYQILKVGADGGLLSGAPLPDASTPYATNPFPFNNPIGGALGVDLIVFNQIVSGTINAGLYRINPFYIYEGTGGGSVNFLLIKENTQLGNYAITRNAFVDNWAATVSDYTGGYAGNWHNVANQEIANNILISYNRSNPLDVYLESGVYRVVVFVHTLITTLAGQTSTGFYEFTQIG